MVCHSQPCVGNSCDSVISVSVLGLRGGRNLDRLQRTYYQGGVLAGEDEDSCYVVCCAVCLSDDCQYFCGVEMSLDPIPIKMIIDTYKKH